MTGTSLRSPSTLAWPAADGSTQHVHGCDHDPIEEIRECPDEGWTGCKVPVRITRCSLDGSVLSVTTLDGRPHGHHLQVVRP